MNQKESRKKWREKNKEHIRQYNKEYCQLESKRIAKRYNQIWQKSNKERHAYHVRRNQAKRYNVEGSHTAMEWNQLLEKHNYKCLNCGEHYGVLHRDHIIPLSRGGTDNIDNIQPLCRSCNCSKGVRAIDYR